MLGGDKKDQMDPEDLSRLFIFFVLAVVVYFTYDYFILKPQATAIKQAQQAEAQMAREEATKIAQGLLPAQPLPRDEVISENRRLEIDNGEIYGSLSLEGGRIDDIALREYYETLEKKENVVLLSPNQTTFPRYIDYGWAAADNAVPVPDSKTMWRAFGSDRLTPENPVTLIWDNGQGLRFERMIALDEHYMFTVTQKVTNNSGKKVTLYPYGLVAQQGIPEDFQSTWLLHEGPMGYIGESLYEVSYSDLRKGASEQHQAVQGWIGITDKYWLTSLVPPQGQNIKYSFGYKGPRQDRENKGRYQADFVGSALVLEPGQSGQVESHIFAGAKKYLLLNNYQEELSVPNFDLAINFGWFWFLSIPFFYALHFLGDAMGNVGFAIIALTIVIRGAVFPLTNASYRSFAKMKKVTPQVAALRESYGDDKQKLQEELMKLYQSEGVNPMAGCFPILLQIPIFFALYKLLFVTIEVRHAPFFGWIQDLSAPDPTSIFNLFGLIPIDLPEFLNIGVWPCVMLVAMLIQKRLNPPPQDKLQRDMMAWFPFIITYVLSRFASGLVIYWTFSAIIGVIQQIIIMRSLGVPIYLFGQSPDEEKLEKAMEGGPDVHPLAEMAEEEAEEALFGDHSDEPAKPITPPKPKKKKKKK